MDEAKDSRLAFFEASAQQPKPACPVAPDIHIFIYIYRMVNSSKLQNCSDHPTLIAAWVNFKCSKYLHVKFKGNITGGLVNTQAQVIDQSRECW